MKTTTALFGTLAITLALSAQVQAQAFLTNSLVAYYPFNGNAIDETGHGNDGVAWNVAFAADRFGTPSAAAQFSGQLGTNSAVDCPTLDNLPYLPITYSCWFKLDGYFIEPLGSLSSQLMTLIGREQCLFPSPEGSIAFLTTPEGSFTNELAYYRGSYAPPKTFRFNAFQPLTNRWYHGVLTIDANALMTFLIDGQVYASQQTTAAILTGPLPLPFRIGGSTLAGTLNDCSLWPRYSWRGSIDDVRIYNRALSASEVQQLYLYESNICLPHAATATAELVNGFVVGASLTDGGCGYTKAPLVLIQGGGGTGATATAAISNGVVVSITITDAGIGYTSTPTIYIYSPFGLQIGLMKAVRPLFSNLLIATNYQLQVSGDMNSWTNQGSAFTATNNVMNWPQYFDVDNWGKLFFRLQAVP